METQSTCLIRNSESIDVTSKSSLGGSEGSMGTGQGWAIERLSETSSLQGWSASKKGNIRLDINNLKRHFGQARQEGLHLHVTVFHSIFGCAFFVGLGSNLGPCACCAVVYQEAVLQPSCYAEMGLTTAD